MQFEEHYLHTFQFWLFGLKLGRVPVLCLVAMYQTKCLYNELFRSDQFVKFEEFEFAVE